MILLLLQKLLESRVAVRVEIIKHLAAFLLLPEPQIARLSEFGLSLATFVQGHNVVPIYERDLLANVAFVDGRQTQV